MIASGIKGNYLMSRPLLIMVVCTALSFLWAMYSFAQDSSISRQQDAEVLEVVLKDDINPGKMPSLVFTYWEHAAILDAKKMVGSTRIPTESELAADLRQGPEEKKIKPPPEKRDISLEGIVYIDVNDWTIWLNGKRVTPDALPREALDLKVYSEYIELKWFDDYSNQILPIRLRVNQRFNIDTRIFLPG